MKQLDLSNNLLTKRSGEMLAQVLKNNLALRELYLKWNQINGEGGAYLFLPLQENCSLKVLDLSWNSLGAGSGSRMSQTSTEALCEMLRSNKHIVHMDLSNNNFSLQESSQVAEALEQNQTIYGLHFQGNFGYVDP